MKIVKNLKIEQKLKNIQRNQPVRSYWTRIITDIFKFYNYDDIVTKSGDGISKKVNMNPFNSKVYTPPVPLIFNQNKFLLIKAGDFDRNQTKFMIYALYPLSLYTGYKAVKSLIFLRPVRTVLWTCGCLFFVKFIHDFRVNQNHFIDFLYLLDDGKRIEVIIQNGQKKICDISSVRKLTPDEGVYLNQMIPIAHKTHIPLVIDNHFYLMPKESYIPDKGVFAAVTNGKYIKVSSETKIQKEQVIDIDSK